jgi:hypothetical protein
MEMTPYTGWLTRIRLVPFLGVALVVTGTASRAQIPDPTQPPPILNSAGQFSARRLSQPPMIDGREWIAAEAEPASDPDLVPSRRKAFSFVLEDCGDYGDFQRCRLLLRRGKATPVRIDAGSTGWVFVTPDERYVITEPLYVLDVREWKQYALFEALQIPNYTSIEAISPDGKRLFISRQDCGICRDRDPKAEYYELTLP